MLSSLLFSACNPSVPARIFIIPSAILIESFALIPTADALMLYVPPVIFTSSFPVIPFAVDSIFNVPVPLNVISCFENITAFKLLHF